MAARYVIPTFNVVVNIWRGTIVAGPPVAPALNPLANLSPGILAPIAPGANLALMILRVAALTDIRDPYCTGGVGDYVECPAGSGRWYQVTQVDDVAKSFTNEHRFALLAKCPNKFTGALWGVPIA
jgi:hypothetical protein